MKHILFLHALGTPTSCAEAGYNIFGRSSIQMGGGGDLENILFLWQTSQLLIVEFLSLVKIRTIIWNIFFIFFVY